MRKYILLTLVLSLLINAASAASVNTTRIEPLRGEKWWGLFVSDAPLEPFTKPFTINTGNFIQNSMLTSMMISSAGRYIWSSHPIKVSFDGVNFDVSSNFEKIEVQKAGKNLREAYLVCCHKHFPPDATSPSPQMFAAPVYNPQTEIGDNHTSEQIVAYAERLINDGFAKGIIVIPDGWQRNSPTIDFDPTYYPNPRSMVERLHQLGFKVMLTVTPFAAASGREYLLNSKQGGYLCDNDAKPYVLSTANGYQVCRDMGNSDQVAQLSSSIGGLKTKYGIDGVRFDCHDALPTLSLNANTMRAFMSGWLSLSSAVDFSEYLPAVCSPLMPYINCIQCGSEQNWATLRERINDLMSASLAGYPYNHSVPAHDAVFMKKDDHQKFMVRSLQLAAWLPVMNVDFAPWRITDPAMSRQVKNAFNLREQMSSYITELVAESARTAEPLIRHMEYQFPRNGFSDCNDQFMFGHKYLFAPILDSSDRRMVRLPRGIWVDSQGRRFRGPVVLNVKALQGEMIYYELTSK